MWLLDAGWGFAQRGGGVYAEDGAKMVGTVVVENRAMEDGFGIYGGNGVSLLNCTVGNNEAGQVERQFRTGDIYCEDGNIVTLQEYEAVGRSNAAGVVFWVNSDYYAVHSRAYIVALRQEKKVWGESAAADYEYAVFDTASYAGTAALLPGSEAARYCREYVAGGMPAGIWQMPAAYQLSCLFGARIEVERTFNWLKAKGVAVDDFEEEIYWSTTKFSPIYSWGFDFTALAGGNLSNKGITYKAKTESCWVRPVLAY